MTRPAAVNETGMRAAAPAPDWHVSRWFNAAGPLALADLRGKIVVAHAFQMLCPGCVLHGLPQAQRVQGLLFESGEAEYCPPEVRLALRDGDCVGMLAFLRGAELRRRRLANALLLARAGHWDRRSDDPAWAHAR